jgi:hypothetical protein
VRVAAAVQPCQYLCLIHAAECSESPRTERTDSDP